MTDPEDEWSTSDPNVCLVTCDRCHEMKLCLHGPDPFIAEVYPEDEPDDEWLCYPCWSSRKDQV
jgi:hypothetical protein